MAYINGNKVLFSAQIHDGYDRGFADGQNSLIDESKIIPKTAAGAYISVDDVSEIPHNVGCKVESVNLWSNDNSYTFVGNGTVQRKAYLYPSKGFNCPMVISCEITSENLEYTETGNLVYLLVEYEDSTTTFVSLCTTGKTSGKVERAFNEAAKGINFMVLIVHNRFTSGTATLSNIMLNKGTTALPYTPYVKPKEVKVTRTGRNMLGGEAFAEKIVSNRGTSMIDRENKTVILQGQNVKVVFWDSFEPNTQYTIFSKSDDLWNVVEHATNIGVYYTDGTYVHIMTTVEPGELNCFTTSANKTVSKIQTVNYGGRIQFEYDYFGLFKGKLTPEDFEPYNGQTLIPATDGTVEEMTSVSPYMNVFSDTDGVNIEANYNKSYGMDRVNQEWWDNFQNNGDRKRYDCAFMNWNRLPRKGPRFDFTITTNANSMFRSIKTEFDLEEVINSWGVAFDTSKATTFADMFVDSYVTNIGELDCSSSNDMTYLCMGATHLTTIKKLKLPTTAGNGWYRAFDNATALANIEVEGQFYTTVSFQYSPLTKTSITSVINTLSDTVTGQTLTLNITAVNNAFETTAGAADGSTSTEFAALVATKTNWTIALK